MPAEILTFVSRATTLRWRQRWSLGRWVRVTWTAEEQAAIRVKQEEYRRADAKWAASHGLVPGVGVEVLQFLSRMQRWEAWLERQHEAAHSAHGDPLPWRNLKRERRR
jgi:hypothetical protein